MAVKRSELKEWAKENMKGVENALLPSFTPDLSGLDEEGIRWDVRQSIKHGFFATLCCSEAGLTFEEAKRFLEIVADEAKGKIFASTTVLFDSFEQNFEMLKHAKKVGCHHVLIGYPPNFYPKSEEEIYRVTKEMCDAVPDLGIVLFPTYYYNFERFHPSGFPPGLLSRMADIKNTVAMKIGINEAGFISECFHRCGEKVLVSSPQERWAPLLVPEYGQQWIGAAAYELYQSPEKPYLVEYFNLMLKGQMDKAMKIYWKLKPVRMCWEARIFPTLVVGTYHWPQWKYFQWLVGGNGGYTRQPVMKMYQHDMDECKMVLRSIGITPREPDEEFYVGRVNYAKAKKAK